MAVKAAAEQADDGGYRYLRRLREGLMCERRKLDHAEALVEEAARPGLDVERFRHRPALACDHGGLRGRPRAHGGARWSA